MSDRASSSSYESTHKSTELYIGVMSGTSLDGIDFALVDLKGQPRNHAHHHIAYDDQLRQKLRHLCESEQIQLEELMVMDAKLGRMIANGVLTLLNKEGLETHNIAGIGSHGQTVRHCPPNGDIGTTLQIADPNTIATQTGIPVVADFRRANLANGGHGAPLAPAFHAEAFGETGTTRAIVNIGGMANITVLQSKDVKMGFDCGPGNVLMDGWIAKTQQQAYDQDGCWAASGKAHAALLAELISHPFFAKPVPKSTGREEFNLAWLQQHINNYAEISPEDVQASLLDLTANTIASSITKLNALQVDEVYVCGGGAYNLTLVKRLAALLPDSTVSTSAALGMAPDLVECCAFAWFAQQTISGRKVPIINFTGGQKESILGGIFYG